MDRHARCETCGNLMAPVRTMVPGIAGMVAGGLVACGQGQPCTLSRRTAKAMLTAGLAFVLGKVVETVMQRVCRCP